MTTIKVSAPGKIHLLGEHAVVYGKPALLAAVDKRCVVSLTPHRDSLVKITSKSLGVSDTFTQKQIQSITKNARKLWQQFVDTNDINVLKSITVSPLHYAVIGVGETLDYYRKSTPSGFSLEIDSQVPIGAGLGSSSVLGVTIAGAVTLFLDKPFNHTVINEIAYMVDQKRTGLPSGADNATSCFGKVVWYRKETPTLKIILPIPFEIPKSLALSFFMIYTGTPAESTGEMVGIVRNLYKEQPLLVEKFLNDQERLTRDLVVVVKEGNVEELIKIIKAGERNLESIGVVSTYVQGIIRKIEKAGGAAKICGAGGKTKATGVLLALHKEKKVLQDLAKTEKLKFFSTSLGVEGLREERI